MTDRRSSDSRPESPQQPVTAKGIRTRERLLASAREAFAEVGYTHCSLRQIAAGADVNVALVNRYFGSKEELFAAALEGWLDMSPLLAGERSEFGARYVKTLRESPNSPLQMMILALADPATHAVSLKVQRECLTTPLAEWLGPPHAQERAAQIVMIGTGYSVHTRVLVLDGAKKRSLQQWTARLVQDVVDNLD